MRLEDHILKDARCEQWHYWTVAEYLHSPELGRYGTYGILAASVVSGGWMLKNIIHDVALDCETVKNMSELFTAHQLSPIHLLDAVQDMLP